ncbi:MULTISPECIES: translational GTPase TypA [unclassified Pyramidobacter]|uniref:translational GTPase TypA n=1 Tax=unclassified Pyramidobacter TaxID=2632171 RepID=UPI00098F991A|nr:MULTISPECIES: translational GTPase TypA [unclassified Pyramidobacter]MCI7404546.1 translational GTPase TypA [Pyramidobacter sp.]MDY3213541.1 translational GTPase TypA [Pyramidobacter sp.]OON88929.1 GTP-binding protein TypA [Pyramidobacter sp. C12-8]
MYSVDKIRNLAIVAHIDHGKTTLIDSIFRGAHTFRENAQIAERVMDSGELERERGITITSKHCTVEWNGYLINIIDTPGHADFSGEVERVLSMVDSVLLLVDANEGPMPQTRYVLSRALAMGLKPIVIINKVDRPAATPYQALEKTFDLFLELGATDEQADFPVLYGSGLAGWLVRDLEKDAHEGMDALFQTIVDRVPPPPATADKPFLMQVSTLAWNDYVGQIACGRVVAGTLHKNDPFVHSRTKWIDENDRKKGWETVSSNQEKAVHLWVTRGLERVEVDEVFAGDIVWLSGPKSISIGDTMASEALNGETLHPLDIEEPTVSMFFLVNNSPFAGRDGTPLTLRQLKGRLERECQTNVALRVEDLGRPDGLKVSGRGELQMAILVEQMIREGSELCVSRPEVITKTDESGHLLEPIEQLIVDVPETYQGVVIEKLAGRKAEMVSMNNLSTGIVRMEFDIPTRGLLGYRNTFLTDTRGLGIMSSRFRGYDLWRGEVVSRNRGSMVSMDTGTATSYQLENLQERGVLFISPGTEVYAGEVIGEHSRPNDIPCNPTKRKAQTNYRSSTKEMGIHLDVPRTVVLDRALEWIADDELVEATPKEVRIRKTILDMTERKKAGKIKNEA